MDIIHREAEFSGPLAVNKYHLEREIAELLKFAHPLAQVPPDHAAFAEIITRLESLAWMMAELRGKFDELRAPRVLRQVWPSHSARAA